MCSTTVPQYVAPTSSSYRVGLPPSEAATKGHHTEQLHVMLACRRYMKQYHSVM